MLLKLYHIHITRYENFESSQSRFIDSKAISKRCVRSNYFRRKRKNIITPILNNDPIRNLGKKPIRLGIRDASINLDNYLHESRLR